MADPADPDAADPSTRVDYAWVMQTTFVVTILVGAPLLAGLSAFAPLSSWEAWVGFAVRGGAVVWLVVALSTYAYARHTGVGGDAAPREDDARRSTGDSTDSTEE